MLEGVLDQADVIQRAADHGGADIGKARHGQEGAVVGVRETGSQQGEHHDLPGEGVDHRGQDADDEITGDAGQTVHQAVSLEPRRFSAGAVSRMKV